MILTLSEQQVKEAVAAYLNSRNVFTNATVSPEHVTVKLRVEGRHDESETFFDGVTVDVDAALKSKVQKKT